LEVLRGGVRGGVFWGEGDMTSRRRGYSSAGVFLGHDATRERGDHDAV